MAPVVTMGLVVYAATSREEDLMAKIYATTFEVQGKGPIPADMLRYDACFPATSEDAAKIDAAGSPYSRQEERREVRTITLRHYDDRKNWEPTAGRWQSFLWNVVPDSVRAS